MTRGGKVLFSFIALVLGTFLFTVFVHYQFVYSLNIRFIKPEEYPLIGNYMPFYFYWGSVIGNTRFSYFMDYLKTYRSNVY